MRHIYKIIFFTVTLFSITNHVLASELALTVQLPDLSSNISYQRPARLSQLLFDTQALILKKNADSTFWLAAQLLEEDKNKQVNELKNNVLQELASLGSDHSQSSLKANLLTTFIENHHFNYRHFVSLDNDLVRITAENDPLLKGKFTLLLPSRVNKIRIIGAIAADQTATLVAHASIDDYLKKVSLPANSNSSLVYVIQPDGVVNKKSNRYWSHDPTFFAPGATLFLGFNSLSDEYASLNEQIAELLRYMSPLTKGVKE